MFGGQAFQLPGKLGNFPRKIFTYLPVSLHARKEFALALGIWVSLYWLPKYVLPPHMRESHKLCPKPEWELQAILSLAFRISLCFAKFRFHLSRFVASVPN